MAETKLSERVMNRTWRKRLMTTVRRLPPLSPGWKGAAIALSGTAGILFLVQSYLLIGSRGPGDYVIGTAVFLLAIALISGGIAGLLQGLGRVLFVAGQAAPEVFEFGLGARAAFAQGAALGFDGLQPRAQGVTLAMQLARALDQLPDAGGELV